MAGAFTHILHHPTHSFAVAFDGWPSLVEADRSLFLGVAGDWRQTDAPSGGRRKRPVVSSALPPAISGDMPWATKAGGVGVVLAGGAVASMVAPGTKPGDYDLWLVVPSQVRVCVIQIAQSQGTTTRDLKSDSRSDTQCWWLPFPR